jgi:hypothetical protein
VRAQLAWNQDGDGDGSGDDGGQSLSNV